MEPTPQNGAPQLQGNVMFYTQPEALSLERHKGLGVRKIDQPFGFYRKAHAVPLTVSEFGLCAGSFPVIFVGEEKTPIGAVGIRQQENVFVDTAGQPEADVYVPAFVRRYPFVFAGENDQDRLILCIDRQAPMITDNPEVPFFEGDEASKFTNDAIEFCKEFERQRRATVDFVKLMTDLDLFEEKSVSFTPRDEAGNEGEPQKIADYWAISEERVNALSAEQFEQLRANGAIGAIYSHLVSLLMWPKVIQRGIRLAQTNAAPARVQI